MNPESTLAQLGITPMNAVMLMETLGVGMDELVSPQRMAKLQAVIDFFKQFPEDTQRFMINKAVRGKTVDKLDHMFEYVHLLEDKMNNESLLDGIIKEKSMIDGSNDVFRMQEVAQRESEVLNKIDLLKQEIEIYLK